MRPREQNLNYSEEKSWLNVHELYTTNQHQTSRWRGLSVLKALIQDRGWPGLTAHPSINQQGYFSSTGQSAGFSLTHWPISRFIFQPLVNQQGFLSPRSQSTVLFFTQYPISGDIFLTTLVPRCTSLERQKWAAPLASSHMPSGNLDTRLQLMVLSRRKHLTLHTHKWWWHIWQGPKLVSCFISVSWGGNGVVRKTLCECEHAYMNVQYLCWPVVYEM